MTLAERRKGVVVRPYSTHIRDRIVALLKRVNIEVEIDEVLTGPIPDEDAVHHLLEKKVDVLLIPYHALKDKHGEFTTGLNLVRKLRTQSKYKRTPVIMPVTRLQAPGFSMRFEDGIDSTQLFVIKESDLDDVDKLTEELRAFL